MSADSRQSRRPLVVCRARKSIMEKLVRTTESGTESPHSDTIQDLVRLLERVLVTSSGCSTSTTCRFCSFSPMIMGIAIRLESMDERSLLDWICQLQAIRGESTGDLRNICHLLKEQLQSIMDAKESEPKNGTSSLRANILDAAHDLRVEGGNVTNVAGLSNLLVFIKQEESTQSSINFRNALVLLLLTLFVFRLLY